VVIARLPDRRSLLRPRSHCPGCGTPIRPYDNVPVLSWLLLRGRCRSCGESISARYPLVEVATAALCALVIVARGTDWDAWLGIVLVLILVPIAFIDLEHRIIPNRILLPGALAAVAIVALAHPAALPEHLIAAGAAGGFLLLAVLAYPRGMGMGDVKLAAVLGLFLGRSVAPAMLAALLSGTLLGAAIMARKGTQEGRKTAIPFGPFLALGALVGLFAGPEIVDWYRHTFL
jgi:leader peptidase (prepilin peptidase)/N-methyltransferase